jgi:hypothetical protein
MPKDLCTPSFGGVSKFEDKPMGFRIASRSYVVSSRVLNLKRVNQIKQTKLSKTKKANEERKS